MDTVEIPTTVIFEAMLKKLDIPGPFYNAERTPQTKLVSSVAFYPPSAFGFITLEGLPMDTLDEAHNDAARKGLKYMEVHEHKVPRDYSYDKLIDKKTTENDHINKIIENNRRTSKIIKEKDEQIKKMRKCWADFIDSVGNENDKITATAKEGYACGTTQVHNEINNTLAAIETGTEYITQLTFEATDQLQQVARYPHDTDTESDQSPGYYPTPPQSPTQDRDNNYEDTYLLNKFGLCAMDYM